jgi:hypothetical protein
MDSEDIRKRWVIRCRLVLAVRDSEARWDMEGIKWVVKQGEGRHQ